MKPITVLPILSVVIASVLGTVAADMPKQPADGASLALQCLSGPGGSVGGNLFLTPPTTGSDSILYGHESHSSHSSHQSHMSS